MNSAHRISFAAFRLFFAASFLFGSVTGRSADAAAPSLVVGAYQQDVRIEYSSSDGLLDDKVNAIIVHPQLGPFAGTTKGLCRFFNGRWQAVPDFNSEPVVAMAAQPGGILFSYREIGRAHV